MKDVVTVCLKFVLEVFSAGECSSRFRVAMQQLKVQKINFLNFREIFVYFSSFSPLKAVVLTVSDDPSPGKCASLSLSLVLAIRWHLKRMCTRYRNKR